MHDIFRVHEHYCVENLIRVDFNETLVDAVGVLEDEIETVALDVLHDDALGLVGPVELGAHEFDYVRMLELIQNFNLASKKCVGYVGELFVLDGLFGLHRYHVFSGV